LFQIRQILKFKHLKTD